MATIEGAVIEGEFEVETGRGMAVATRPVGIVPRGTPGSGGLIRPIASPSAVMEAQNETRAMVHEALEEGRDFGKIPGAKKPSLWKAGAERVNAAFAVYSEFEVVEKEIDHDREVHWTKTKDGRTISGIAQGLYRYVLKCYLIQRESGAIIATGVGSCSTLETKYVDRPRDLENTVFKMAKKRAYVDATLTAYGLSDEFTQDVEDMPREHFQGGGSTGEPEPECPICKGPMWDNREGKRSAKAPDYKCKDKSCKGCYWPGQWPPKEEENEADERARLLAQIDSMVEGIRRIDPTRAEGAATYAAKVLDAPDVKVDAIRKLGGEILVVLQKMEAERAAAAAEAPAPEAPAEPAEQREDPMEDNPFGDEV